MADGLSYEIEGLEDVINRLSPVEAEKALRNGMQVAVLRGHRQLSENLTGKILKRRTGRVVSPANMISTEVRSDGGEVTGTIAHLARWRWRGRQGSLLAVHEYGATIVPRDPKRFLVFEVDGKKIFAKRVTIPARKPMSRTLEEIRPKVVGDIREALRRRLNGEPPLGSGR
jgi:hypothetical protein